MEVLEISKQSLVKAVSILNRGDVLICPTDTVYGFLADASNKKAVEKIYKIKKRPKLKPLPVFVADIKMAKEISEINREQEIRLRKFWPGAYTFVLKRNLYDVGRRTLYYQDEKTIALRIPKHAFLQKLLKKVNRPMVQTSVNLAGQQPLNSPDQIMTVFGKSKLVGLIITSSLPAGRQVSPRGKSSKVIDLTSGKKVLLRN